MPSLEKPQLQHRSMRLQWSLAEAAVRDYAAASGGHRRASQQALLTEKLGYPEPLRRRNAEMAKHGALGAVRVVEHHA